MQLKENYDHYYLGEEIEARLHQACLDYPDLTSLETLTTTADGYPVYALTITDKRHGGAQDKPAYYIDANIHAGEVTGSMVAMGVIDGLLNNSDQPEIQKLLTRATFYILPRISMDGAQDYLTSAHKLRSSHKPYPYQDPQDGLHPQDIDGDGSIRMMRIPSPYGVWKISPDDERIMIKRLPQDHEGPFYHVFPEGLVQNYNGTSLSVAPAAWGLDFNRNFPFGWFSEARQPGAGQYPLDQPETSAMAHFVLDHPNICFVSALHTSGGVLVYPPGTYSESKALKQDMKLFHDFGKLAQTLCGYETKNIFDEFLSDTDNYSSGAFDDWCYETQGIPAYTIELWDLLLRAGIDYKQIRNQAASDEEQAEEYHKILVWLDEHGQKEAIKPWTALNHPQLGPVEIGGFDTKFTIQNPPLAYLKQEVEKMSAYLIQSAFALPQLTLSEPTIAKLGTDLYEVKITIANHGYMDSCLTQKAQQQKLDNQVVIDIATNLKVLTEKRFTIENLAGYGSVDSHYSHEGIMTKMPCPQQKELTWIIQGQGDGTIQVNAKKGGTASRQFHLG